MIAFSCNGFNMSNGGISFIPGYLKDVLTEVKELKTDADKAEALTHCIESLLEECPLFQMDLSKVVVLSYSET